MRFRRFIPVLLIALIVAAVRGVSALAQYYTPPVELPSTGSGSSAQLTGSLPMVGLTVLALAVAAVVIGSVVRRTRAGETA